MRRIALTLTLAGSMVLAATAASPAAGPTLGASPNPVRFGQTVTIKGRGWPVIEFCERRVRLSLQSTQNAFGIGRARVRDNGRFTRRWTPDPAKVGPGRWTLVARLRCESGKNGSPFFVRRSLALRIR